MFENFENLHFFYTPTHAKGDSTFNHESGADYLSPHCGWELIISRTELVTIMWMGVNPTFVLPLKNWVNILIPQIYIVPSDKLNLTPLFSPFSDRNLFFFYWVCDLLLYYGRVFFCPFIVRLFPVLMSLCN